MILLPTLVKYSDVVRQRKTILDNLEERIINGLWNIDEHGILSWNGPTRCWILNKRPPKGY